jgi:hypothetical protein
MSNVNPAALFRALIVYAICVPAAILVGYLVTDPLQQQSIAIVALVLGFLVFPILIKWHYPLLIFSWSLPVSLFFLPGHPSLFLAMVAISLTISVIEKILDRNRPSLSVPSIRWGLVFFLAVILLTAKLTGGFGLRSMGSEVYGGKKYVFLIVGILAFFAVAARPIPKKYANLYMTLFLIGGVFSLVSDLYGFVPDPLKFIYLVIPPADYTVGSGDASVVFGRTRLGGVAGAGTAIFFWMLARHGLRENLLTAKLWRPALLGLAAITIPLGGYRSSILAVAIIVAVLFCLEKLHRTGMMIVVLMMGILGGALLVPLAPHLPFTFQRALAFLPLDISVEARMDTEDSTQWRLNMWSALLPQIPKYLLLGKGYAFSSETYDESMARDSAFHHAIDAAEDPLALASDFHNGPLSVVISLGLWGVVAWLWFWLAGFFVVWRNYRFGDPDLRHINNFILASFITKCTMFLLIAGSMVNDVAGFTGIVGLSVALNHGVRTRKSALVPAQPKPTVYPFHQPAAPAHPPLPAVGG